MWELQLANPFAKSSARKLLTFVAATLVTIFSYLLLSSTNVSAADATWEQGSIVYNNDTYRGPTEPIASHNLPAGSVVYTHLGPVVPFTPQRVQVIYFPPGSDTSTAEKGSYVTYDRSPTGSLSNKSTPRDVTFDVSTLPESQEATNSGTSSCKLDGIGWMICPATIAIAEGMDWIFNIISGFFVVRPLDTLNSSTMYKAWEVMRNFANIMFVIAFLVVIYSQLTSTGINNYGIKNMLPRLIIASILVNVSYWICAIGIDVSNILGQSLQDLFINLRNTIQGSNANSWELISWQNLVSFILSGGVIAGAAIAGATAITGTLAGSFAVGGVALMLAPILLGAFLTVLVVLFILAARQAIITILVVIAPLAFVAYILPNTDKWFEKWRSLFMTMLIMFPAFSVVFGGAQLAGILIIQNAKDINVVLLGMAVQIAPLAITPLLFKLSGSLLGRIAGMINNPSKGVLDRTKNWSKDRLEARGAAEMRKNRENAAKGQLSGKRNFARRAALRRDRQKRLREGMKAINEADSNALFMNSAEGRGLHQAQFSSNQLKERIDAEVNIGLKRDMNREGSALHAENVVVESVKARLKEQESVTTQQMAEYRTEKYLNEHANPMLNGDTLQAMRGLQDAERQIALRGLAAQSAKRVESSELAQALEGGDDPAHATIAQALRREAAGIDNVNGRGEIRILSEVKSQIENEKDTLVKNIKIANDIKPGDAKGLARQFEAAVESGNAEGMRAYADLLVEAANPGVVELRKIINSTESRIDPNAMVELKAHINSSPAINGAAEDIASWSRGTQSLDEVTHSKKTWEGLTASAFAGMKKSSQEAALYAEAITKETAIAVQRGPVFQNLKPDMRERIKRLAAGREDYKDRIEIEDTISDALKDPFFEPPTTTP